MKRFRIHYRDLATGNWWPTGESYNNFAEANLWACEHVRREDAYQATVVDSRFRNRECLVYLRDNDGQIIQRWQRVHVKRQRGAANG